MTTTTTAAAPARKATRREWLGLIAIAFPCMIYSMDLTVLNLAVPTLTRELKPTAGELLWIIDIYGFMVAGFLMTMGTLGDRIGRRKLLLIGAAAFGLASTVAAFSTSTEMLIVMRALLGIAGATLAPSTLSLIAVMFEDETERTFAISMWIASFSAGAVIGPLLGGALIVAASALATSLEFDVAGISRTRSVTTHRTMNAMYGSACTHRSLARSALRRETSHSAWPISTTPHSAVPFSRNSRVNHIAAPYKSA